MKSADRRLLRLIAAFKLVKAATLIATGVGVFKLIHADIGRDLDRWAVRLGLDPESRLVGHAIEKLTNIPPHRMREFGIVSFIYAGFFLTEGVGLWLLKRWAEWFTVILTGSLLPIEIYEILHHPTIIKILILIINLAVVLYLVRHVLRESRSPWGQHRR